MKECHRFWLRLRRAVILISNVQISASMKTNWPGGGAGRPYEEYTRVCHVLGSYFQGKGYVNFSQKFREILDRVSYFDGTKDEDRID